MATPVVPKALFFDVFGTLVDWRTSIAREAEIALKPLGSKLDWLAFADAWRDEYQPAMDEVRSGRIPFSKLDVLHRRNLERIAPRFSIVAPEEVLHHLAWPGTGSMPGPTSRPASCGSSDAIASRRSRTATSR
jgi:2-haloacid dehalogenase